MQSTESVYTSPSERPDRLYRQGREIIAEFKEAEALYLRFSSQNFSQGQLTPYGIRSQLKQSVNRGRFSEPEDVLFSETGEYDGLGVIEFRVEEIPARIDQLHGPTYIFFMWHEPEETNYSHSEIWSDQQPRTNTFRKPSKTVSLEFRMILCRYLTAERIRVEAER